MQSVPGTRKRKVRNILALAIAVVGSTRSITAAEIIIASPTASYQASTNLLAFTEIDGTDITTLTNGLFSVNFSIPVNTATVPDTYFSWSDPPFSETSTPRVLVTPGSSLTMSFSAPVFTFGFEAEPNLFGVSNISALFRNGGTNVGSISLNVNGDSGARLFALSGDQPFDNVVVGSADRFAIASLRYSVTSPVPEPGTTFLFATALTAFGLFRRSKRNRR